MNSWTELHWWLLAATISTVVAAIATNTFIGPLYDWGGELPVAVFWAVPFVAEAFIQFRSRWRRLLWIFTGILTVVVFDDYFTPRPAGAWPSFFYDLPFWILGPITFLPSAILEFVTASRARKRPWIWIIVTPPLLGLMGYWMKPISSIAGKVLIFIQAQGAVTGALTHQLYVAAAIYGTVFFTRAFVGSFIASRKLAQ
jgi:hypothetical protein